MHLPLGPLGKALLRQEFVEELTDCLLCLCKSPSSYTEDALENCLFILQRIFSTPPGYMYVPEALGRGLLRGIISCATLGYDKHIFHLNRLLQSILPANLVYYYVIAQIKRNLSDAEDLASTPAFQESEMFTAWQEFVSLAKERVQLLVEASADVTLRACDNIKCGDIQDKQNFRRCSGCKSLYYCSPACQIDDWQHGGHREACSSYGHIGLTSHLKSVVISRERSLSRALLHRDYQAQRRDILVQQVHFMAARPNCAFFTAFDYTNGRVKIDIQSVKDSPLTAVLIPAEAEWGDTIRRMDGSAGRIQLHILQLVEGNSMRVCVVPLRTNAPDILRQLREIARRIGEHGTVDLVAEIDALVDNDEGLVEIH